MRSIFIGIFVLSFCGCEPPPRFTVTFQNGEKHSGCIVYSGTQAHIWDCSDGFSLRHVTNFNYKEENKP